MTRKKKISYDVAGVGFATAQVQMVSEQAIAKRLRELDQAIADLQAEKRALTHLLYSQVAQLRAGRSSDKRTARRLYNEAMIERVVSNRRRGASYSDIRGDLLRAGVIINDNTLRSYLSRMREANVLRHDMVRKRWYLATQTGRRP